MQKFITLSVVALVLIGLNACESEGVLDTNENLVLLEQIVPNYVDNTVISTYKSLADKSIDLYEALAALKADKTDANVQNAVREWIDSRNYWELSEAFLFGAAADFGIDPHIDTWPLDRNALIAALANTEYLAAMAAEDGAIWAGNKLSVALLGFHAIEYILFENGQPKPVTQITENQLIYAVAVAGDLRNQCICLEAAWAGYNNVLPEKQTIINKLDNAAEIYILSGKSYGNNMKLAGNAGSNYRTITDAAEAIIEGCINISDEVAAMKIGKPYSGEDVNYIESPYSFNSKTDFAGNIESIRNAYLGGVAAENRKESLHTFFNKVNKNLDTRIIAAIDDAVAKINAIPFPFAQNYTSAQAGAAIESINVLTDILTETKTELRKAVE